MSDRRVRGSASASGHQGRLVPACGHSGRLGNTSRGRSGAPPHGLDRGFRQQTEAAPAAMPPLAATRAALPLPAATRAALAAQDAEDDLRWALETEVLSRELGYGHEYGQHFILDKETVYRTLSSFQDEVPVNCSESLEHEIDAFLEHCTPTIDPENDSGALGRFAHENRFSALRSPRG